MNRIILLILTTLLSLSACNSGEKISEFDQNYRKINIAELYMLMGNQDMQQMHGDPFVFRGKIFIEPELTKQGYFGIVRVAMVCCAADTVAVGFKINMKQLPTGLENGDWVKVYGHNEKSGKAAEVMEIEDKTTKNSLGIPIYVLVPNDFIFIPDKIETIQTPDDGYIYYFSTSPPFHY
jgi:uncharacterized membrane protein YcgQ (UPF0703/DUF1980 family)